MITRIWHSWTTCENADAYEELLRSTVFPNIADREIRGYEGAHLRRRDSLGGVEFNHPVLVRDLEGNSANVRQGGSDRVGGDTSGR